jgi:elongation factor Ts
MAEVTAQMVKELREKTGAGISLCKEALVESDGSFEEAELYIRKKDKDKAAKRAERATGEGVVFVKVRDDASLGCLVEIACETDFVARNEQFQALGDEILAAVEMAEDFSALGALTTAGGKTIDGRVEEAVATIGENMRLRSAARLGAPGGGAVGSYSHFNNKAASLVALKLEGVAPDHEAVQGLLRDLCMHITSCRPLGLTSDDLPADLVAKEKEVFQEEVKDKPEEIQEKILQGKLGKFFATTCLAEQGFVKDEKTKIKDHVTAVLKEAGGRGEITGFARLELGTEAVCVGGDAATIQD